ncbi:glycerate kinase, partial [Bradyrhizobium sp. NBAIM08]|uniref:glycerate kinase n=1 Tax=Bradyrhizobium sp. NBAIM08 TaxID=2793815 RepID=UPI001CD1ACF2
SDAPGAGACGGVGFAVLALGGRLSTGPEVLLSDVSFAGADLVVTGCSVFDFAARGRGVVKAVAEAAAEALSPCIAIAGQVVIGAREMRTMGIDAAYAVRDTHAGPVDAEALTATARRVARSWSW